MSASVSSLYEHLFIDRNGKRVDLAGKTISFKYYESLFSPVVTANMVLVDTGSSPVPTDRAQDSQGRVGSIVNSLPITGNENVEFKIRSKQGTLDFELNPLVVNGSPVAAQEANREAFAIALTSRLSVLNEKSIVYRKYTGKISDSVRSILEQNLKIKKNKIFIDDTKIPYNFNGSGKDAFKVVLELASKSIPADGKDPGYFFYETADGVNFKSITKLISQAPKATYVRNSVLRADDDNDFKILSLKPFKNQNTINALRSGVYASKNIFFNPYNYEYSEKIVKLSDQKLETYLGKQVDIPVDLDNFTRIHYHILDVGSMDSEISINVNNDPREWQARSSMRYNLLFTQGLNIVVPCNPQLKAGDVVNCFFEKVTVENKNLGAFDEHQSGKYLIAHLCHSFDPKRSFTSLTLVRDTYGLYKK
jgi:hypothetical protein